MKDVVSCPGALKAALCPRFGPRRFRAYLDTGGSPGDLAAPDPADLQRRLAMPPKEANALARELRRTRIEPVLEEAARLGVRVVAWGDAEYPALLKRLDQPPPALFVKGQLPSPDDRTAAVVGSRRATRYGLRLARTLATDLVRAGFVVVSGMARGIDAAAHEAALAAGDGARASARATQRAVEPQAVAVRTVAVMGSGFLQPYPPEHIDLLERIAAHGAVISEFALDAPPQRANFPRRNRIVAALSEAVLVVEAGRKSGALTTARHASDMGIEVLAVPGPVDREQSLGTLALLRDGATPLASIQDVFATLGFCDPARLDLPDAELAVLEILLGQAATPAQVAGILGWHDEVAAGYLVTLEIRGLVERETGGRYVLR